MPANNKILVGGQPAAELRDVAASGAITPGHLVEYTSDRDTVQAHGTDAGFAMPMFANIVPYSGDPDTGTAPIEDAYADGDYVKAFRADDGNRVTAIASEAVSQFTPVCSAGDGRLRAYVAGTDEPTSVVGVALEATTGADERFTVEV